MRYGVTREGFRDQCIALDREGRAMIMATVTRAKPSAGPGPAPDKLTAKRAGVDFRGGVCPAALVPWASEWLGMHWPDRLKVHAGWLVYF